MQSMSEEQIHPGDGIPVKVEPEAVAMGFHACCFKCGKKEKAIIDLTSEEREVEFKKLLHVPQNGVFICYPCAEKSSDIVKAD